MKKKQCLALALFFCIVIVVGSAAFATTINIKPGPLVKGFFGDNNAPPANFVPADPDGTYVGQSSAKK